MIEKRKLGPLPDWLRGLALLDFIVAAGIGGIGLLILSAFMPYGHPQPLAATVYLRFTIQILIIPLMLTTAAILAGRWLYLHGRPNLGVALLLLPLATVPWLLMQALQ